MKIGFWLAALLALNSGCTTVESQLPAPPTTTKRALTAEEISIVQQGVRRSLKDPHSAIFGSMTAAKVDKNSSWVCGVVNAKNNFGGYTGNKPFMGQLAHIPAGDKAIRDFSVVSMGGTDSATYAAIEMCRRYGVI
ncbi:hypothetical protein J2T08_002955 [Neorhizobium galegae]|uniref:hypothetical protein n=1 Tax=Neorhizobium galegae TaxID=399 RepID=UPI002780A58E|nr:hypothetical protein [Neorhizobium galegae]MDQ0135034.1 hypothetical protein [Neorhizobium galegae]